jgi:3-dehydroquinate dehydratase type I
MASQRMGTKLICPLTSGDAATMRRAMAEAKSLGADAVELRLDCLSSLPGEEQLRALLAEAPLETIVTCRPKAEGGRYEGDEAARLALLGRAAELGAAWIDVEAATAPTDRPAGRVILSRHDFAGCPADLDALAADLDAAPAAASKLAFVAAGPEDALRAFDVLRAARKPAIALAMGEPGVISRILARKFGALGTFAALARGAESAPGQPTLQEMIALYRWEAIGPGTTLFGVIGCPVAHSMSPAIHNAAFAAAGLDAVYVPLLIQPGEASFRRFLDALRARPWMNWRGLSVTIPHKENALAYVGAATCAELARKIGAVNTLTLEPDGSLRGDNTDYAGAMDALCGGTGVAREALAARRRRAGPRRRTGPLRRPSDPLQPHRPPRRTPRRGVRLRRRRAGRAGAPRRRDRHQLHVHRHAPPRGPLAAGDDPPLRERGLRHDLQPHRDAPDPPRPRRRLRVHHRPGDVRQPGRRPVRDLDRTARPRRRHARRGPGTPRAGTMKRTPRVQRMHLYR